MRPSGDRERLRGLHRLLEQALAANDWNRIAQIDRAIAKQLQAMAGRPATAEVLRAKNELKILHAQAVKACERECEKLRQRLMDHLEYGEARAAYRQIELTQGGS